MSELLCYWEEAVIGASIMVRWKLKLIALWANCCWSLVTTVKHSCRSNNPSPLFCSISDYSLSWQMLLTHWTPHELPHLSPGLSDKQGAPRVCSSNFMRYNFWSKLHFYMKFLKYVLTLSSTCVTSYRHPPFVFYCTNDATLPQRCSSSLLWLHSA